MSQTMQANIIEIVKKNIKSKIKSSGSDIIDQMITNHVVKERNMPDQDDTILIDKYGKTFFMFVVNDYAELKSVRLIFFYNGKKGTFDFGSKVGQSYFVELSELVRIKDLLNKVLNEPVIVDFTDEELSLYKARYIQDDMFESVGCQMYVRMLQ